MTVFNKQTNIVPDVRRGNVNVFSMDKGTPRKIINAIKNNQIDFIVYELKGGERLDVIAGRMFGDSGQWRVIAAANGIGWSLQVQPGTQLFIPTNLSQVYALL
jgi:hypothetical protein